MIGLRDFIGLWKLDRVIDDALAGAEARLTGSCRFTADPEDAGTLIQEEKGLLQMPGLVRPVTAERRYLWRAQGADISVFFEDERVFHSFDPNRPDPAAEHDCAPDRYAVRYDFSAWPVWSAVWTVKGPRKAYVSRTRYTPQQLGDLSG
ncbi:DUF6314 family protein [Celeribacter neptunius]|uniref:DUF6314 domain-containing protein n=1 Tax=Celeribacter neptunius TaxID=588602 RepID=A0A1I3JWC0_9RHOB|nr:DUF6314 family protein [Celeribacter neptunius]SFI64245.1 hypothetical protein SAMN04487991_0480 [Celeribacter neptunius]